MVTIYCHSNQGSYPIGTKQNTFIFVPPDYRCYMWNLVRIGFMLKRRCHLKMLTNGQRMPAYTISSPMSLRLRWAKKKLTKRHLPLRGWILLNHLWNLADNLHVSICLSSLGACVSERVLVWICLWACMYPWMFVHARLGVCLLVGAWKYTRAGLYFRLVPFRYAKYQSLRLISILPKGMEPNRTQKQNGICRWETASRYLLNNLWLFGDK